MTSRGSHATSHRRNRAAYPSASLSLLPPPLLRRPSSPRRERNRGRRDPRERALTTLRETRRGRNGNDFLSAKIFKAGREKFSEPGNTAVSGRRRNCAARLLVLARFYTKRRYRKSGGTTYTAVPACRCASPDFSPCILMRLNSPRGSIRFTIGRR